MRNRILWVVFLLGALAASSCVTAEKVVYLQDMEQDSQIVIENKYEAKISPNDELQIYISCHDEELSKPFNLGYGMGNNSAFTNGGGANGRMGYLVDNDGYIEMPILGRRQVAGKTRLELQNEIKQTLVDGKYLEDPYVMVRFNNYKIFFLGSNGGKAITIPEERCTFLEALSLSGDLNMYTRRDKIAVLREVDGKMTMRYLDPRSAEVFNDPYYMLQQNDIILTQSFKADYVRQEFTYWTSWLSILSTLASIATVVAIFTVPGLRITR